MASPVVVPVLNDPSVQGLNYLHVVALFTDWNAGLGIQCLLVRYYQ